MEAQTIKQVKSVNRLYTGLPDKGLGCVRIDGLFQSRCAGVYTLYGPNAIHYIVHTIVYRVRYSILYIGAVRN